MLGGGDLCRRAGLVDREIIGIDVQDHDKQHDAVQVGDGGKNNIIRNAAFELYLFLELLECVLPRFVGSPCDRKLSLVVFLLSQLVIKPPVAFDLLDEVRSEIRFLFLV